MLANSCEWFETNVAVARLGAQLVPVNWHLRRDELAWILEDSDARVLVTGTELAAEAEAAVAARPGCHVLRVGDDYDAAIAVADPDPEAAAASGFAPAIVLYTSGTTGRPKGVVHEQASTARSRQTHVDLWGFTRDDVHLLVGPAYHGAPWSYAVTHLALGATVVVMRRWDAREFLRLVEQHRVTNTFLVPTHFSRLLELPEPERSGTRPLVAAARAPRRRRLPDRREGTDRRVLRAGRGVGVLRVQRGRTGQPDRPGGVACASRERRPPVRRRARRDPRRRRHRATGGRDGLDPRRPRARRPFPLPQQPGRDGRSDRGDALRPRRHRRRPRTPRRRRLPLRHRPVGRAGRARRCQRVPARSRGRAARRTRPSSTARHSVCPTPCTASDSSPWSS